MKYTVYKLINGNTGKTYTGCTERLAARINQHFSLLRSGRHCNKQLLADFICGHRFSVVVLLRTNNYVTAHGFELMNIDFNSYNIVREGVCKALLTKSQSEKSAA